MSESGKYFRTHPKARAKKQAITKKDNARPEQKKKRRESGRKRYAAKKAGKSLEGKDYDHATGKFVSYKTNRGRSTEGGRRKGVKKKK